MPQIRNSILWYAHARSFTPTGGYCEDVLMEDLMLAEDMDYLELKKSLLREQMRDLESLRPCPFKK